MKLSFHLCVLVVVAVVGCVCVCVCACVCVTVHNVKILLGLPWWCSG